MSFDPDSFDSDSFDTGVLPAASYYVRNEVRQILLNSTLDSSADALIYQEGPYADRDVENDLFAFSDVAPPYVGDDITADIRTAANWRTVNRIYSALGQEANAKRAYETYLSIMGLQLDTDGVTKIIGQGGIIGRLKATPTARTTPVLAAVDPRDAKTPLPCQSSIFAFDDYA